MEKQQRSQDAVKSRDDGRHVRGEPNREAAAPASRAHERVIDCTARSPAQSHVDGLGARQAARRGEA